MSVLIQFSLFPIDRGESLSSPVSKAVTIIEESGLSYTLGPMGTSIEGEWNEVLEVITRCFEMMQKESNRIYLVLNADYRKGRKNGIAGKVLSIQKKREKLKT